MHDRPEPAPGPEVQQFPEHRDERRPDQPCPDLRPPVFVHALFFFSPWVKGKCYGGTWYALRTLVRQRRHGAPIRSGRKNGPEPVRFPMKHPFVFSPRSSSALASPSGHGPRLLLAPARLPLSHPHRPWFWPLWQRPGPWCSPRRADARLPARSSHVRRSIKPWRAACVPVGASPGVRARKLIPDVWGPRPHSLGALEVASSSHGRLSGGTAPPRPPSGQALHTEGPLKRGTSRKGLSAPRARPRQARTQGGDARGAYERHVPLSLSLRHFSRRRAPVGLGLWSLWGRRKAMRSRFNGSQLKTACGQSPGSSA